MHLAPELSTGDPLSRMFVQTYVKEFRDIIIIIIQMPRETGNKLANRMCPWEWGGVDEAAVLPISIPNEVGPDHVQ